MLMLLVVVVFFRGYFWLLRGEVFCCVLKFRDLFKVFFLLVFFVIFLFLMIGFGKCGEIRRCFGFNFRVYWLWIV